MKPKLIGSKEAHSIKIAKKFRKEFVPKDKDYDWVYLYSQKWFNMINENIIYIDDKADNMLKYLAPSSGLLGILAILLQTKYGDLWLSVLSLIGIGFIVSSICVCINILWATDFALPPATRTAITKADEYSTSSQAKAKFSTSIDVAAIQNISVIEYKSQQLNIAYWLFAFGIGWVFFVIPLLKIISLVFCH